MHVYARSGRSWSRESCRTYSPPNGWPTSRRGSRATGASSRRSSRLVYATSEDTIRRDLRALAAEGRCRRVYGGALPSTPCAWARSARGRASRPRRRRRSARRMARLVEPGMMRLHRRGHHHARLRRAADRAGGTVITHAPAIAAALVENEAVRLVTLGGQVDRQVGAALGGGVLAAVEAIRPDLLLLGACGIDADARDHRAFAGRRGAEAGGGGAGRAGRGRGRPEQARDRGALRRHRPFGLRPAAGRGRHPFRGPRALRGARPRHHRRGDMSLSATLALKGAMPRERAAVSALFLANGYVVGNWAPKIPSFKADLGIDEARAGADDPRLRHRLAARRCR